MEPSMDEILERATYYYKYDFYELHAILNKLRASYQSCWSDARDGLGSTAVQSTIGALTGPDCILFILQLTQPRYEAIKALPRDQLPLLINENLEYPDVTALYQSRLKNG